MDRVRGVQKQGKIDESQCKECLYVLVNMAF